MRAIITAMDTYLDWLYWQQDIMFGDFCDCGAYNSDSETGCGPCLLSGDEDLGYEGCEWAGWRDKVGPVRS